MNEVLPSLYSTDTGCVCRHRPGEFAYDCTGRFTADEDEQSMPVLFAHSRHRPGRRALIHGEGWQASRTIVLSLSHAMRDCTMPGARIEIHGQLKAMVIAGQFYAATPDPAEEADAAPLFAQMHTIDPGSAARCRTGDSGRMNARKHRLVHGWKNRPDLRTFRA